ncbi:MAG TPA: VanZ family protein [Bacillota bacterium]|nr:VanZ family protein [Bacillota bacterium]
MADVFIYLKKVYPFLLILIPVYIVFRIVRIHTMKKRCTVSTARRETALFSLFAVLTVIFSMTLTRDGTIADLSMSISHGSEYYNFIPFKAVKTCFAYIGTAQFASYFVINWLGNILLFVPVGFLIPLTLRCYAFKTIAVCFASSAFIETFQIFLPRMTDIDDVIMNTAGAAVGCLIYFIARGKEGKRLKKFRIYKENELP